MVLYKDRRTMRGLSIRQPWAELILSGHKTIECRSRPTRILGRVWIYASAGRPHTPPRGALIELASLPRGAVVGSVEIVGCRALRRSDSAAACFPLALGGYAWLLASPRRLAFPRRPTGRPQPVFFYPFGRAQR
jgi:hypothetical protein